MKNIRTITIPRGKRNHTLIDLQQLHEPPTVPGKVFSLKTAAAAIGVSAEALSSLRASGDFEVKCLKLLDGWNTPTALRISEQSITRFKEKYVSLASIAREIGTRASFLMGHCAATHIPMGVVPSNVSRHAFVHLKDRSAVLSFRPARWWNQQRSAERKRRLTAKERDRIKVLHEVKQGHITKKQAAVELGLSVRRVLQLLVRWRAGDDNPLRHGPRGATVEPQNAGKR